MPQIQTRPQQLNITKAQYNEIKNIVIRYKRILHFLNQKFAGK